MRQQVLAEEALAFHDPLSKRRLLPLLPGMSFMVRSRASFARHRSRVAAGGRAAYPVSRVTVSAMRVGVRRAASYATVTPLLPGTTFATPSSRSRDRRTAARQVPQPISRMARSATAIPVSAALARSRSGPRACQSARPPSPMSPRATRAGKTRRSRMVLVGASRPNEGSRRKGASPCHACAHLKSPRRRADGPLGRTSLAGDHARLRVSGNFSARPSEP